MENPPITACCAVQSNTDLRHDGAWPGIRFQKHLRRLVPTCAASVWLGE